jgi:beta-glucosidase
VAHCEKQLAEILTLLDTVPTVVAVHLERPTVIPEIAGRGAALAAPEGC